MGADEDRLKTDYYLFVKSMENKETRCFVSYISL